MPVILATQEAKIRTVTVQIQPRQIACKTLSGKTLLTNGATGVAQAECLCSSPSSTKRKRK
jgi:hypothetical protein